MTGESLSRVCPLCGKTEEQLTATAFSRAGFSRPDAPAWRAHLATCAGGDDTRAIAVTIPFIVHPAVSMESNHVTYSCAALGLEYRFYYPEYLDREKCAARIAAVQPYPDNIVGAARDELPRNELCHALMEWRALVNAKQTAEFTYQEYRKLADAMVEYEHSRISYRIRQWWKRIRYGARVGAAARRVGQ